MQKNKDEGLCLGNILKVISKHFQESQTRHVYSKIKFIPLFW